MKFKAAVLCELKKPLEILEIEPLKPLQPGQVLVKIFYSGICGSQLGEIDGKKGHDKYLPHLLGHEGSGEVVEIGPGVRFVRPGDRVVLHWKKGSGIEAETAKFACGEKIINSGWVTTFSEYTVVSENRVTPIPADFDLRLAPLFGCAVTTGFGAVVNDAKLKIGESAVVRHRRRGVEYRSGSRHGGGLSGDRRGFVRFPSRTGLQARRHSFDQCGKDRCFRTDRQDHRK